MSTGDIGRCQLDCNLIVLMTFFFFLVVVVVVVYIKVPNVRFEPKFFVV